MSQKTQSKVYLEWSQIWNAVDNIVEQIKDSQQIFLRIYGIHRGGVIPAAMIARKLNVRMESLNAYGNVYCAHDSMALLVDDIFDTGKTINTIFERANWKPDDSRANVVTLQNKMVNRDSHLLISGPDFYHMNYSNNEWLVYPWEIDEDE